MDLITSDCVRLQVYVLPYEFWYYNGPRRFSPENSYIFTVDGCAGRNNGAARDSGR